MRTRARTAVAATSSGVVTYPTERHGRPQRSGALTADETVVDGFERIVEAFLPMLRRGSTGKVLVGAYS